MSICFDTLSALDQQTDRWMDRQRELVKQYHALHALHVDV